MLNPFPKLKLTLKEKIENSDLLIQTLKQRLVNLLISLWGYYYYKGKLVTDF